MYTSYAEPLQEVEVIGVDANVNNETFLSGQFGEVLKVADEPLWGGCDGHTKLSVTTRLLNIKA